MSKTKTKKKSLREVTYQSLDKVPPSQWSEYLSRVVQQAKRKEK